MRPRTLPVRFLLAMAASTRGPGPNRIVSLNVINTSGRHTLELWRGTSRDEVRPESGTQVRWSPDGRRLAVAYGDDSPPESMAIDVIDLDSRERHTVVSGEPFAYPRWSQSGDWLYVQRDATIERYHLATGVSEQVYGPAGLGIQRNGGFDLGPADGALATRPKTAGCVVRIAETTGAVVDRHVFNEACRAIAWSRDGSRILVSTVPASDNPSLWNLDRAGGDPVRLPIEAPIFHDLSLDPTDRQLLFTSGNPRFDMVMLTGVQGFRR